MTRKERAKEYSDLCSSCIQSNGLPDYGCGECEKRGEYNGYIKGAIEQEGITKQEMIDKVCEWIDNNKQPVLASETDDTIVGYSISVEIFLEWLKTMEK